MDKITVHTHNLKPHSIAGDKVEVITRHPENPHPLKDTQCNFTVYAFRSQDNTEVKVLASTDITCLGDHSTRKSINDKLTGKKVLICSKDRKHISNLCKVGGYSHTHGANYGKLKDYTYCELHEEYPHILKKSDYLQLHNAKIAAIKEEEKKSEENKLIQ